VTTDNFNAVFLDLKNNIFDKGRGRNIIINVRFSIFRGFKFTFSTAEK